MILHGDEAQVEARFSPFGDSANIDADRCIVCAERTIAQKSFWTHPLELLGDVGHVESHFAPFGYSVSVVTR
jgi:hypothetical protein